MLELENTMLELQVYLYQIQISNYLILEGGVVASDNVNLFGFVGKQTHHKILVQEKFKTKKHNKKKINK